MIEPIAEDSVRGFLHRPTRPSGDAIALTLRHAGLVGLGTAFFLFWTFIYLTLWWSHPHEAFRGLAQSPRFARRRPARCSRSARQW